jgi:transcriptional regulator with XRE-family HTH domain
VEGLTILATRIMTPSLCREARTLLDIDLAELAFAIRVSIEAMASYEGAQVTLPDAKLMNLRLILERSGVEFLPERNGRGVRLKG